MIIALPPDALVLLVGPSGAGKSTFAARHFASTEILSSDAMRAMVADDPMDQAATEAAFELLHTALAMRLSCAGCPWSTPPMSKDGRASSSSPLRAVRGGPPTPSSSTCRWRSACGATWRETIRGRQRQSAANIGG